MPCHGRVLSITQPLHASGWLYAICYMRCAIALLMYHMCALRYCVCFWYLRCSEPRHHGGSGGIRIQHPPPPRQPDNGRRRVGSQ